MAVVPIYLADKSALARLNHQTVNARLGPLLTEGLVATCSIIDLEVLYSARTFNDYEEILRERRAMPCCPTSDEVTGRAIEVQHTLARAGHHRIPIPDLLIAATAEICELTVMHYDADYERIADLTGQSVEWVVPRGSI